MSMPTGRSYGNTMTGAGGYKPSFSVGKEKGGYRPAQLQQFSPEQMNLFKSLFSQVAPGSFTSQLAGGDESMFQQLEAPALRQFSGLQGNIASRFSGMGSGARRSSGFQNTMNEAASNFAQDLQSQRLGLQRNAIRDLQEMSNQLLQQRPYENFLVQKQPSALQQFLSQILGGVGQGIGSLGTGFGAKKLGIF
jgi:hypothetical protein